MSGPGRQKNLSRPQESDDQKVPSRLASVSFSPLCVFFFYFTPRTSKTEKCWCVRMRVCVRACVRVFLCVFYLILCVFVCALKSHRLRVQSTCVVPGIFDDFCVEGSNADEGRVFVNTC